MRIYNVYYTWELKRHEDVNSVHPIFTFWRNKSTICRPKSTQRDLFMVNGVNTKYTFKSFTSNHSQLSKRKVACNLLYILITQSYMLIRYCRVIVTIWLSKFCSQHEYYLKNPKKNTISTKHKHMWYGMWFC